MSKKIHIYKTLLTLPLITLISFSHIPDSKAGLSWLSRANCLSLNESITWDPFSLNWLWTYTSHFKNGVFFHGWNTGWSWTSRSYAGDSDDFFGSSWYVWGNHYRYHPTIGTLYLGSTSAVDCNLSQW